MRNVLLSEGTARDIDRQVEKVLRGLGNPQPPLDLDAVFALLKLDPQYYRTSEDGVVRETVSRVKIGAKLVFEKPTRIWEAIRKADLKALWVPEQRRILVDGTLHQLKQRWSAAHEIGHSLLDWHEDYTFGDTKVTLTETCREMIEAEANHAAGRLLFLQQQFDARVLGLRHTLKSIGAVAKEFGNSWTSTLYRTVETLDVAAFAVIGSHPRRKGDDKFRYFVASRLFRERFGTFDERKAQEIFAGYCGFSTKGPLGEGTFSLRDVNGDVYEFTIESFAIPQGEVLTLAQCIGKTVSVMAVPAIEI